MTRKPQINPDWMEVEVNRTVQWTTNLVKARTKELQDAKKLLVRAKKAQHCDHRIVPTASGLQVNIDKCTKCGFEWDY